MKKSKTKNNLITILGGTGFIGTNLVHVLSNYPNYKIRVFARKINLDLLKIFKNIEFLEGDFSNQEDIKNAIKDSNVVIHLISASVPGSITDNPIDDVRLNLIPTLWVLESAIESNTDQIIFVSSGGAVYGIPKYIPIDENHEKNPISSYGITKLAIENYLELAAYQRKINICILRVSNPYGKYQSIEKGQGIIGTFAKNIANSKPIHILGDGSIVRDFIHINDVVNAIIKVINNIEGFSIYNIGSSIGRSINDIISIFKGCTKNKIEVEYHPSRIVDVPINVLNSDRFRADFNWECSSNIKEEIEDLIEWYKEKEAEE